MKKITVLLCIMMLCFSPSAFAKSKQKVQPIDNQKMYLNLDWWKEYNDPMLVNDLTTMYQNNHDLKIATLRVKETEKLVRLSLAQEMPSLGFTPRIERNFRSSDLYYGGVLIPDFSQTNFNFPLTMNYEVDIWGSNRLKTKSVEKRLAMANQDEKAAYISLTSAFTADYFNLIKLDKLIQLQSQMLTTQKQIVSLVNQKQKNGLCPVNIVLEEEKALTYMQEDFNNLKDKREILSNQMNVLLADSNMKPIERNSYDDIKMLDNLPQNLGTEVIQGRPDLSKAELNLQRVGYDIKIARRDFLPKFLLYGQVGFNAYDQTRMFAPESQFANLGVLPSLDLFSGGRKVAMLKLRKYQYKEATMEYEKAILESIQEVNDSLGTLKIAKKNYGISVDRQNLENKEYSLISQKHEIGAASNLDTLYLRERNITAQKSVVSNKISYLIETINLYKAVGGKNLYDLNTSKKL